MPCRVGDMVVAVQRHVWPKAVTQPADALPSGARVRECPGTPSGRAGDDARHRPGDARRVRRVVEQQDVTETTGDGVVHVLLGGRAPQATRTEDAYRDDPSAPKARDPWGGGLQWRGGATAARPPGSAARHTAPRPP